MNLPFLKSPPGETPVIVEAQFAATPERVFRAWTRADEVVKWFGPAPQSLETVDIDLREGGSWRFAFPKSDGPRASLFGEYVTVEQDRRLVFTWHHQRQFDDGKEETTARSQVTVTFEPKASGTFVRLVHEAIREEDARKGVGRGWNAGFTQLQAVFKQTAESDDSVEERMRWT